VFQAFSNARIISQFMRWPEYVRQVNRLHAHAEGLQELLTVVRGIEGIGPRPYRTEPGILQPLDYPAHAYKLSRIRLT
jgi:hypothetical protein